MGRLIALCAFWCVSHSVLAQDTLESKVYAPVAIEATRVEDMGVLVFSQKLDSTLLQHHEGNTLSEVLQRTFPGQMRGYGPSGIATPSFRGTGASHTAVLWNGINISSPLLGQFDLSQIPVVAVDEVKIEKGGASSQYGSGAIGGTIHLNQHLDIVPKSKLSFGAVGGSFGRRSANVGFEISGRKFASSTKLYAGQVDNRFPFHNTYIRPAEWQDRQNNRQRMMGFVQQFGFRINPSQRLDLSLWHHSSHYQVPNNIIAAQEAKAYQTDEAVRGVLSWNYQRKDFGLTYKQAFSTYSLLFEDSVAGIHSRSSFTTWTNRMEGEWELGSGWKAVAGANHTLETVLAGPYGADAPHRHNFALYAAIRWQNANSKLASTLSIREEIIDGVSAPLSPNLGAVWQVADQLKLKGNISRNYRVPTFNDLYWTGSGASGNRDLQPESSIGGEIGAEIKPHQSLKLTNSVFHQSVDNWILWQPIGAAGWTPVNIKKVWARGLESRLEGIFPIGQVQVRAWLTYQYTRTTNEGFHTGDNGLSVGKQLAYSPMHEGSAQVELAYKKATWLISYAHVGKQYTEDENKEVFALPAYGLLSTSVRVPLRLGKSMASFWGQLNNLLDTPYENRRGFPMYRRNFQIGLNVKLNFIR